MSHAAPLTPPPPDVEPRRLTWVSFVGIPIALLYAIADLVSVYVVSDPERSFSLSPLEYEAFRVAPGLLLAVLTLVAGLLARRVLGAILGSLLVAVTAIFVGQFDRLLPREVARYHLSESTARDLAHVVLGGSLLLVTIGWCLARRRGASWLVGLVPALLVSVAVVAVVNHLYAIVSGYDDYRHTFLISECIVLVGLLVMVLCCWGAERLLTRR